MVDQSLLLILHCVAAINAHRLEGPKEECPPLSGISSKGQWYIRCSNSDCCEQRENVLNCRETGIGARRLTWMLWGFTGEKHCITYEVSREEWTKFVMTVREANICSQLRNMGRSVDVVTAIGR